jgi:hypothetical protein
MTSWLERADHTADDFEDFAAAAEGAANERARWEAQSWERRARSELYPRMGRVDAAPIAPPLPRTHGEQR